MLSRLLLITLLAMTAGVLAVAQQPMPFRARTRTATGGMAAAVDNSALKYFPPVLNQLGGSCAQAAGIGYMFTYEVNRLLDRDASASAANRLSYQFAWNMVNEGLDQGGFVSQGLQLARQYGIMTEADYGLPFLMKWPSGYEKYREAMRYRTDQLFTFDDSVPLMKRYLYDRGDGSATGGVLTFSGQAQGWAIRNDYQGPSLTGYHSLLTSLATDGSHAMTIVGYDDAVRYADSTGTVRQGAFIVANSWGTEWQDRGRFYLPYHFFSDPSVSHLQLSNSVNGVSVRIYEPQVLLKVRLSYTSRDDLSFAVATAPDLSTVAPLTQYPAGAFDHQGGDLPMMGPQLGSEIELALDMTDHVSALDQQYFLNVVRGFGGRQKGEGQLLALSAIDYRSGQAVEYPCRDSLPRVLQDGNNYFAIPLRPRFTLSASPLRYADESGSLNGETFLIRTADGGHAKVRFSTPDTEHQTITIRYETKE